MHVVVVVPGGVDRSGTERVIPALLWFIAGLAPRHRVTVVALGQEPEACSYPLLGATVVNVPPEARGPHRLARMVARGVAAAASHGRPDVVCGFWASVSGLIAVAAGRRWRAPVVVHVAGGELVAFHELAYGGSRGRGGRLIARAALAGAQAVTVSSRWMATEVGRAGYPVDAVIPLGVDTSLFRPLANPRPSGAAHLVQVANLNPVKDQSTLLRAMAEVRRSVPTVSLEIIGVDTMGGAVQAEAARLGLQGCVRFAGFVPSGDLPERLGSAALHVLTSRHDAAPVAVLEAAACGVATVGTDVGYVADFARLDPPAARRVAVGDHHALAEEIVALLADDDQRAALGLAAARWARDNDAATTVSRFEELFGRLAAR